MTPDFAEIRVAIPLDEQLGRVFRIEGLKTQRTISTKRVSRAIPEIGPHAGVVVDKAALKFTSAHGLRRSFGTRWSSRVKPATLQLLMRHASIHITMNYYVAHDADELCRDYSKQTTGIAGTEAASNNTASIGPTTPMSGD
jgi:integrase